MKSSSINVNKLANLKGFLNEKYLNPMKCDLSIMKCDLSFMKCNLFLYFVIGAILLFSVLILFFASKYSGMGLLLSTLCLCIIFVVCSLILLNLCISEAPSRLSYITIASAILLTLLIVLLFKKK